jgi:hypothetical protein
VAALRARGVEVVVVCAGPRKNKSAECERKP